MLKFESKVPRVRLPFWRLTCDYTERIGHVISMLSNKIEAVARQDDASQVIERGKARINLLEKVRPMTLGEAPCSVGVDSCGASIARHASWTTPGLLVE